MTPVSFSLARKEQRGLPELKGQGFNHPSGPTTEYQME